jgi:ATP phosphoribosyltransferase regulatory subunit
MRDRLFNECALRREQETELRVLFEHYGFSEVSTPILEHYELFTRTGSPFSEETLVKVIDRAGRICVLRPDNTAPIARLAASRLQNEKLPLKLWYQQPVYRVVGGGCAELPQAGVEVIGSAEDTEVLKLALEAVRVAFRKEPHIEISHAGILQTLISDLSPDSGRAEFIHSLIERKNFSALGDELPDARDFLALLRLSGGAEVLDEAERTIDIPLIEPLNELRALLAALPSVTVDFGMAPAIGYYTGVFFRGYVDGAAGAVLTGGRYDRLLAPLGRDVPAVGFAIHQETHVPGRRRPC